MLGRIALAVVALTLSGAPSALADGDPASDVLPTQDAFYPYAPPASKPLVTALDALLADVRTRGYPMKVALIETAGDLGSYPMMFNSPQQYTDLLASELPVNPHGKLADELHLLVIMPGGFGGKNLGDRVDEALAPVDVDLEAQTDGLARAALEAVARIATANGVPTPVPEAASDDEDGGGGPNALALVVVSVVIVLLVLALLLVGRRSRTSDDRPDEEAEAQAPGPDARTT